MRHSRCLRTAVLFVFAALCCFPENQDPAPAAPKPSWIPTGLEFSGLVDSYYSLGFNHPASSVNTLRNFDVKANQFSLNFAKFAIDKTAEPVGFKLEFAGGRAMDIFHMTEPGGSDVYRRLMQAYVSLKPAQWHGIQVDVGKFVTSAGAEVTETHLNWNYSRSLLYANGPYYHFGARMVAPVTRNFSAGVQLVNGWNNVEDNNSAKTLGFTTAFNSSKLTWLNAYYAGNEKTGAQGRRHFYDTVIGINPAGRLSGLLNFDYGIERNPGSRASAFYGVSGATKFQVTRKFAISPRYDWYKDRDGLITTRSQTLQAFTATGDMKFTDGFIGRLEYRHDASSVPFFDRGNELASVRGQSTVLMGFIAYFGPKR